MKQSGFLTRQKAERQELLNAGMRRERNGDECSIPVKKSEHGANCPVCGSFFNQEHAGRKPQYCETCGCRLEWNL